MAVLNYHNFDTLGYDTTEEPNEFYSGPQTSTGYESTHIRLSTDNPLIGSNCLRVEIVDGLYRNSYPLCRSEVRTQVFGGYPNVMQGWYAFAFRAETLTTGDKNAVISQLWDGNNPTHSIRWYFDTNQVISRLHDGPGSNPNVDHNLFVASNEWTKVKIYYQARTDSSGILKIWVNDVLTVDYTGRTSYATELNSDTPYWKLGIYSASFGEGNLPNRIAYFDAVSYHDDTDSEEDTLAWINNFMSPEEEYNGPDYYVSSSSGSDSNNGSIENPFATVSHAFSFVEPGGKIYGLRGDEWYEEILLDKSGTEIDPIVFDAYGNTENPLPIMSGFKTLNSWTDIGGGLYRCTDAEITERVNVLIVEDAVQPLGRLPKPLNEYYASTARTGNSSGTITDTVNLSSSPNYAGGEIVIRKNAWVLDRGNIDAHSSSTLTYSGTSTYNSQVGYGYFIQNKRSLCTELHEWCQEGSDIIMYFGAEDPADYVVKAAVLVKMIKSNIDSSIDVLNTRHIHWNNWRFEGYNGDLEDTNKIDGAIINLQGCDGLKWHNCEFQFMGNTLARWYDCPGLEFKWCTIKDCMNMGIYSPFSDGSSELDISFNTFERIGTIPGAGGNSDHAYSCIRVSQETEQIVIEGNKITYCGYNGIAIGGFDFLLRRNTIQYACYLMDDGGCIYHFKGNRNHTYNRLTRIIEYNICLDSPGNNDGKPSGTMAGEGIYIDDNASEITGDEITIRFNICSGNRLGLKLHNCRDITVTDNIFYDNLEQVLFASDTITNTNIRNIEFKRNQLYAEESQAVLIMDCKDNSPQLYGDFDNNYYMRPSNESDIIHVNFDGTPESSESYSLAEWKASGMNHDENSDGTPTTSIEYLPVYNDTFSQITVPLERIYIDVDGNLVDSGEIVLDPFEGALLLDDLGPVEEPPGNTKPTAVIISPLTDLTFYTDTPIEFETFADDPDVGDEVVQLDLYYGPLPIELRSDPSQGQNFFTWANPVAGEHLIMLISTDSFGAMKSDTINLTVLVPHETPVAVISSNVNSGEAPLEVQFTGDQSTDDIEVISYSWDFDDGSPLSTEANPTHTFTTGGNYNVSLTVEDGEGLTDTAFQLITVTVPEPVGEIIKVYGKFTLVDV